MENNVKMENVKKENVETTSAGPAQVRAAEETCPSKEYLAHLELLNESELRVDRTLDVAQLGF